MPLIYSGIKLVKLELIKEGDTVLFKLSDNENKTEITFDYCPELDEEYNHENFELILFENQYLNAENDVFQIFDKEEKRRIGWVFPLSILESNENNFKDNPHLNKYKFVAFQKLLLARQKSIELELGFGDIGLSDIYQGNPILLILSNTVTSEIADFSIRNYIPSLSKYGYYEQNKSPYIAKLKPKEEYCLEFRGKEKINLFKAKTNIYNNRFFEDLFNNHLKYLDHHLIRFHLLYQIIEYILTERFDAVFDKLITDYNNSDLIKNDFIENINDLGKERLNIKKVVDCIVQNPHDFNVVNLERDCKILLESHNKKIRNSLGDLIYDIRNLIVHNYRSIENEEVETLEKITHQLELLTINIIEHYCPQQCV